MSRPTTNKERPEKTFPQFLASYLANDFTAIARKTCGMGAAMERLPPEVLGAMLRVLHAGYVDKQQMRRVIGFALSDEAPDEETATDIVCITKLADWLAVKDD